MRVGIWAWHSPFDVDSQTDTQLSAVGIDEVFVRTATVSFDGDRYVPTLPQSFRATGRRPLHHVLNFDAGAVSHFGEVPNDRIASVVVTTYRSAAAEVRRRGGMPVGLQLDLDCPTRLLPKYGDLLKRVRQELAKSEQLSITGLTTWLTSEKLKPALDAVDFWAPQFYEGNVPKSLEQRETVSDAKGLRRGLDTLGKLDKPFYVGVAAYGQSLLYDPRGQLAGTYRGLSPEQAFRHPSLRFERTEQVDGESHFSFLAVKPGRGGRGLGYRIVYRVPSAESVAQSIDLVRSSRPANCRGVILFRLAQPDESLALALPTLAAAVRRELVAPKIVLRKSARSSPYALIEGTGKDLGMEHAFSLKNEGNGGTRFGTDAVEVVVRFPVGAVESVQAGDFDGVVPFAGSQESAGRVSLRRADGLVFRRGHLGVGQSAEIGPIRMSKGGKLSVVCRAVGENGTIVEGTSE